MTDRAHNTLQIFSMDGKYLETIAGFGLPANVETQGNLMLVPELKACVTLLNEKNEVVARLGRAVERLDEVKDLRGGSNSMFNDSGLGASNSNMGFRRR